MDRKRSTIGLISKKSSSTGKPSTVGVLTNQSSTRLLAKQTSMGLLRPRSSMAMSSQNFRGCPSCEAFERSKLPPCPKACMSDKCKAKKKPVINIHHKPVVWVMGGPGCGKGTQCELIKKKYGFTHISSGDLLRDEVARGGPRAQELQDIMSTGGLVPNEIVLDLVRKEIRRQEPISKGFLIDGYPREEHQGAAFEKVVSPVSVVIYFKLRPETLLQRLKHRAAAAVKPRLDDTDEIFKKRIDTFLHNNQKILNQYMRKLHTINAEASVVEIFAQVQKCLDPLLDQTNKAFAAHSAAISKATADRIAAKQSAAILTKLGPKNVRISTVGIKTSGTSGMSVPASKHKPTD